jgi:hypothetical protein
VQDYRDGEADGLEAVSWFCLGLVVIALVASIVGLMGFG